MGGEKQSPRDLTSDLSSPEIPDDSPKPGGRAAWPLVHPESLGPESGLWGIIPCFILSLVPLNTPTLVCHEFHFRFQKIPSPL